MKKSFTIILALLCLFVLTIPEAVASEETINYNEISESEYIEAQNLLDQFIYLKEDGTFDFTMPPELLNQKLNIGMDEINAIKIDIKAFNEITKEEYNKAFELVRPYIKREKDGTFLFSTSFEELSDKLNIDIRTILLIRKKIWENNQRIREGTLKEVEIDNNLSVFLHSDGRVELLYSISPQMLNDIQRKTILRLMNYGEEDINLMTPEIEIDIITRGGRKAETRQIEKDEYIINSLPSYIQQFTGFTHYNGEVSHQFIHTHYVRVRRNTPISGMPINNRLAISWSSNQTRRANTEYVHSKYRTPSGWVTNNNRGTHIPNMHGTWAWWGFPVSHSALEDITYLSQDVFVSKTLEYYWLDVLVGYGHNYIGGLTVNIGPLNIDISGIGRVELTRAHNFRVGVPTGGY